MCTCLCVAFSCMHATSRNAARFFLSTLCCTMSYLNCCMRTRDMPFINVWLASDANILCGYLASGADMLQVFNITFHVEFAIFSAGCIFPLTFNVRYFILPSYNTCLHLYLLGGCRCVESVRTAEPQENATENNLDQRISCSQEYKSRDARRRRFEAEHPRAR